MKKFIISLLLICTICLGCFALTACDENDGKNPSNEPAAKCEFLKNEFVEWDHTYMDSTTHYEMNKYTFRLWYSYDYFIEDLRFPTIKCSCPFFVDFIGLDIGFNNIDEITINSNIYYGYGFYAEYLTDYKSTHYSIKPNSWIYFSVPVLISDEIDKPQIITIELLGKTDTVAQYSINLTDTYKTA